MDALLGNTVKPDWRHLVGVSLGIDLSGLDICFGGFSPTLMSAAALAMGKAEESEERLRKRKEALARAAEIEAARASDPAETTDSEGNTWSYSVLDNNAVRLNRLIHPISDILEIPGELAGKPVVALADGVCSNNAALVSVTIPDSIDVVGRCAFRSCSNLKSIVFPQNIAVYDSGWVSNCSALETIQLPGQVDELRANVFDNDSIRHLKIGASTSKVYPGAFRKAKLQSIEVDSSNPFLETDGTAIYSKGREALIAIAVKTDTYRISGECIAVARKAADGMRGLTQVEFPQGLEIISEHAFAHTGLSQFVAPESLQAILDRAFFDCENLTEVQLNEGLKVVGENAFTRTKIGELALPASIEQIGHPVAAETDIVYSGDGATFTIAPGSALSIDKQGALLRKCEDGLHLEWLVDPEARVLRIPEGVVEINAQALLNHRALEEVYVPQSVRIIGDEAFKGCKNLRVVDLTHGIKSIGNEAFLDTQLERLYIPASLDSIGARALVTQNAHSGSGPSTLTEIEVSPDNLRFSIADGMLLEANAHSLVALQYSNSEPNDRTEKEVSAVDPYRFNSRFTITDGASPDDAVHTLTVLHYLGNEPYVEIPKEVTAVAPYAFSGTESLETLHLSENLSDIGIRAFAINDLIKLIRVYVNEPVEGHDFFDFRFPETDRGAHQQFVALTSLEGFSVANLFENYDVSIANASNFDSIWGGTGLSLYDQATRIIERLSDPIFMTSVNRDMLTRIVQNNIGNVCVAIAKHDNREMLDKLADLGIINSNNISDVIDCVGAVQDAAMTAYLLEMRRVRFGGKTLDFDL